MINDFAVVGLVEKRAKAFGDDGADVRDAKQLLFGGVHDAVEFAEMLGQFLGGSFTDMPDT